MRVLESRSLTILSTDTCTAKCAHCSMNSSPTRRAKLTATDICNYVEQAAKTPGIRTIIFAGGEPMLLGQDLYESFRFIRSLGLSSRMVTNGYWANSEKRALEIARKLCDAGLDEINISIDDYHLPYVSAENVKRAFFASLQVEFATVILVHASGPQTKFNAKELDELIGMELPRMYGENGELKPVVRPASGPYVAVANSSVQYIGRGSVELRPEEIGFSEGWETKSREIGGCPWAVRSPAISPTGRMLTCCGFEVAGNEVLDIGDLHEESMEALLDRADNDLVLNMIAHDGPYAIMDFLKEQDSTLPFRERYSTFCELCQHLVSDPKLRQSMYDNMHQRAPALVGLREAHLRTLKEEAEFEALYHASDPLPEAMIQ